ncbi:MAG: hypothetical protein HY720_17685 [Planctomycetes bacterium]|nr:hypothetical protein [Planctomycetota bacterium]
METFPSIDAARCLLALAGERGEISGTLAEELLSRFPEGGGETGWVHIHRALETEILMIRYEIASLYACQGEAAKAVEYLDPIVARHRSLCRRIREDGTFNRIRESPEFRELLERRCR